MQFLWDLDVKCLSFSCRQNNLSVGFLSCPGFGVFRLCFFFLSFFFLWSQTKKTTFLLSLFPFKLLMELAFICYYISVFCCFPGSLFRICFWRLCSAGLFSNHFAWIFMQNNATHSEVIIFGFFFAGHFVLFDRRIGFQSFFSPFIFPLTCEKDLFLFVLFFWSLVWKKKTLFRCKMLLCKHPDEKIALLKMAMAVVRFLIVLKYIFSQSTGASRLSCPAWVEKLIFTK